MKLYQMISRKCSNCLITKEMTRRVLLDFPGIDLEEVDIDLEPERARSLILEKDLNPAIHPGLPIPYLRCGSQGLWAPEKMQQIRDLLHEALAEAGYTD